MHSDLIAKLEALDGPSREVDWLIADHFNEIPEHHVRETGWDYSWWRRTGEWSLWKATDSEGRNVELWQPKPVTASLDATVALVERVLPEHAREISVWPGSCHVTILMTDENGFHNSSMGSFEALHEIEAIALLIAALRALEARDG